MNGSISRMVLAQNAGGHAPGAGLLLVLLIAAVVVAACARRLSPADPNPTPVSQGPEVAVNVDATAVQGTVTRQVLGQAVWYSWQAYAWDDQAESTPPAAMSLFASTGAGILGHYPGVGVITHDFHWKNVIGPPNQRQDPTPRQSSFDTPRFLDYGPDEYGRQLEEYRQATGLPVEGSIQVNIVSGSAQEAADWVEYMNAPNDGSNPGGGVDWAARRAANGHPEPYGIHYWEMGNEPNYTASNIGSLTAQEYTKRIAEFVPLMKARDPSIEVMGFVNPFAIGEAGQIGTATKDPVVAPGVTWSQAVIKDAGRYLDYLYFHWYGGWNDRRTDYQFMMSSMDSGLVAWLDRLAQDVKTYAPSEEARQRLSRVLITEWNVYGGWVRPLANGTNLQGAIAYSRTLHVFAARRELVGAIHMGLFAPYPDPPMRPRLADIREGYFLFRGQPDQSQFMQTAAAAAAQLWSEAFEPNVVQAQVVKAPAFGDGTPTLDVTALRSDDGQRLSLIVTNAAEVPVTLQITLANFPAEPSAGILTVTGDSVSANNSWKAPDTIGLARGSQDVNQPSFSFNVPAHSIRALQLKRSSS